MEREIEKHLPESTLIRVEAVDWRTLSPDLPTTPITLFSRYLLAFPEMQTTVRSSHRQLDTLSSVAIFLSHVKCWQWLMDHPKQPCAFILEDDACFDEGFSTTWQRTVQPLLSATSHWDLLVLGFFANHGPESVSIIPDTQPLVTTMTVPHFFGAHAYMITQRGAALLLKHGFPLDHQVDGLFLTLHQLGLLRLHMLRQSVVSQCMNNVNREGSWHTGVTAQRAEVTVYLQELPPKAKLLMLFLVVLALGGWVLWICDKKKKKG